MFTLDATGNATGEATTGQATITRAFNGQQLATASQGATTSRFLYDPAGNVDCVVDVSWAATTCPTAGTPVLLQDNVYDYANRLAASRSYDGAGALTDSADYVNDPLDRPISEVETHAGATTTTATTYVGVSNAPSKEILTGVGATTKRYAYDALGQRATLADGTSRYSYLYDPHGSVSLLLDQTNGVKASYGYSAYGSTIKPGDVLAIRVVKRDGELFTLDNRRLEAFRRAGVPIRYRYATPEEAASEALKFTTRNGGQSVRVRGG